MLLKMFDYHFAVTEAYEKLDLAEVYSLAKKFIDEDVQDFYLHQNRHTLMFDHDTTSFDNCQFVLSHLNELITKSLAPILCFTAQDIYENSPNRSKTTVFQESWPDLEKIVDIELMQKANKRGRVL